MWPVSAAIVSAPVSIPNLYLPKAKRTQKLHYGALKCSFGHSRPRLRVSALKDQLPDSATTPEDEGRKLSSSDNKRGGGGGFDYGWLPAFPHVLVASMSNFIFGYHIGVMNGPIVSVARELGFDGNSFLEGLVVSIFIAGAFIGSLSAGPLADKLGCRLTFQIDTIPLILGAITSAKAHSLNDILGGRFLVGLGIGVNTVLVPIYISEVAPTRYRGALGSLCQIGTCVGIIASLFLGISSENDPHWWRTMLYIASVPGFVVALGMQFAIESPRWLCKAGRMDEAKTVIRELWGASEVENAIEEFQSVSMSDGSDLDSRWSEILEEPHSRGALCALYLVDREGRQKLLIGSYLGMAISMFLVAFAVVFPLDELLSNNLSILGTIMYIFSFAIGAGPVTGIIIPELSSTRTRGKIMGVSFSTHWVGNKIFCCFACIIGSCFISLFCCFVFIKVVFITTEEYSKLIYIPAILFHHGVFNLVFNASYSGVQLCSGLILP
ncbi:probable plastidic glucose transporter 1 isoform X5 [Arachis ipaensis]|uniref:probable plastidic glucose transporter 1 isoform X5 n=1 Tax=Arachis ipaensis TaxID=130454 RepID=UPI000A2B2F7D|nr:probable plastidic glucose transporter 1 isoform X5 [Arachis ipaensis]XP_029149235.1 probable plastidic glucose transporter 1 isoform X4 [Arachis hypogaea]